jgi:transcription elongation factor GreA
MKERILKRFGDEIAALERELKVELPKEIQRARELGDLRENAEYKAAKDRQDLVNARIAMLKKRVGEISMINLDRIPRPRLRFDGPSPRRERRHRHLPARDAGGRGCGRDDLTVADWARHLNKEEGDEIKVTTPNGLRRFELIKVTTIHDDAEE